MPQMGCYRQSYFHVRLFLKASPLESFYKLLVSHLPMTVSLYWSHRGEELSIRKMLGKFPTLFCNNLNKYETMTICNRCLCVSADCL